MKPLISLFLATLALLSLPGTGCAQVVVIVSSHSAIASMSRDQVSAIFLGRHQSFPDGSPAIPLDSPDDTSVRAEFSEKVLGKAVSQIRTYWSRMVFTGMGHPPKEMWPPEVTLKMVAANPKLIGYVDRSWVNDRVKVVLAP